jgi:hypothetical protein
MNRFLLFTIFLLIAQSSYSQIHEFGVLVGGSNFIGDVGSTSYIAPKNTAFGALYKWNRSPRHSFRFSAMFTELEGVDNDSDDPSRKLRGYEFTNDILELSLGMEFTFFDFDLHRPGHKSTPYLYTGVTVAFHDNYFFNSQGVYTNDNTSSQAWGIPAVVGYKTTITDHIILAFEIGARYTFSDELDGSVPDTKEAIPNFSFGNINNNDWYMFTGLTLSYTFGRNPCYCNF